jgi:hypothetical protein
LVLLFMAVVLTACATLTPAQSVGLSKAQQLADEVTTYYGVARVKVIADRDHLGGYWRRSAWITVHPDTLIRDDALVSIAPGIAMATLDFDVGRAAPEQRFAVNRRGVDIMVQFLGLTVSEAVNHYAMWFTQTKIRANAVPVPTRYHLTHDQRNFSALRAYLALPPCEQLRDLWLHFAMTEPMPPCPPNVPASDRPKECLQVGPRPDDPAVAAGAGGSDHRVNRKPQQRQAKPPANDEPDAGSASVLPMALQPGDRFTAEGFDWGVLSHPVALHGAKNMRARIVRPGVPETERDMIWAAHERVMVRRGRRDVSDAGR